MTDFAELPVDALHKYITVHGLVPQYPSQSQIDDPHSEGRAYDADPSTVTEAVDEEMMPNDMPRTRAGHGERQRRSNTQSKDADGFHFFDEQDARQRLGEIATEHFDNTPMLKENDIIAGFLYRCHARGAYPATLAY